MDNDEPPLELLQLLGGQISRGECILFTGAGFSFGASSVDGRAIPSAWELATMLWPIAFPGEELDESSSLTDIFDCALQASESRTLSALKSALTVDANSIPPHFESWLSVPWKRIYTLNIDDLEVAIQRRVNLPTRIRSLSALSGARSRTSDDVEMVHLNGQIEDLPNVTFSPPQYGSRLGGSDPWYPALVADLMGSPIVFVGTTLDESPLWQHLAMRGSRADLDRELRPRSYLVAPSLSPARARLLRSFNIDFIKMDAQTFAENVLGRMTEEIARGRQVLASRRDERAAPKPFERVAVLRQSATTLSRPDFLLGREPVWQDVVNGFAFTREFERDLLGDSTLLDPKAILLTGTAGSGKSTALLRLCLELQAAGKDVAFLDTDTELSLPLIRESIRADTPEVLAIDDVDFMGSQAAPFVMEVLAAHPDLRLIATARGTRAERIGLREGLERIDTKLVDIPHLGDSDVDGLLDSLSRAKRLGKLKGLSYPEQRKLVLEQSNRQLLVAMIQVTSGRQFDEKVEEECRELPVGQSLVYLIVALASRARLWLGPDEILLAAGGNRTEYLKHLDALRRQHLLVETQPDQLRVRHRVIAERVVSHFRKERRLIDAVEGLIFALATKAGTQSRTSREGKLLIRLLNHSFMIEEVGDLPGARRVYESVESLLSSDTHYWLQRGSMEVEVGDLELAENFLHQARGLSPDDPKVQTEWAYMRLKRAAEDASCGHTGWKEKSAEAFVELKDAIQRRGRTDSYPYHVLGSQGLGFVRRAPLTPTEKETLLADLRAVVRDGCRLHPGVSDLTQLRDDLDREYLLLTVPDAKD